MSVLYFGRNFVWTAFKETLQHPDLSVDLALNIVRLAAQHNRYVVAGITKVGGGGGGGMGGT